MRLELFSSLSDLSLHLLPDSTLGIVVLTLYLTIFLVTLYRHKSELAFSSGRKVGLFLGVSVLAIILPLVLRMRFPANGLIWLGLVPLANSDIAIPLLAVLPVSIAALGLGVAPAGIVGLIGGLAYAGSMGLTLIQAMEGAMFGLLLGWFLHQKYHGAFFNILRQPVVATPLASIVLWPIPIYGYLMNPAIWSSAGLGPISLMVRLGFPSLIAGLLAGSVLQVIVMAAPGVRGGDKATSTPPYRQSLAGRLLARLLPLTLIVAVATLVVLNIVTMNIAFDHTLQQMEDVALKASAQLRSFAQQGLNAASDLIHAGRFAEIPPEQWPGTLASMTTDNLPFQQIFLLDRNAHVVASHPQQEPGAIILTEGEITALSEAIAQGRPALGPVYRLGGDTPAVSFVAPIVDPRTNELRGALVGRTVLPQSNELAVVFNAIGSPSVADRAYLIDERGHIILSSAGQMSGNTWVANAEPIRRLAADVGEAYEESSDNGEVQVVYWLRTGQPDWHLVLERGRGSIIQDALKLARPLLFILTGLFILLTVGTVMLVQLQLAPLRQLASAALHIANGDLDTPVPAYVEREDEVGTLSQAIQKMAIGLGSGGEDLAHLAEVSRNVSSYAKLAHTLRVVLQSAINDMGAYTAGIHHVGPNDSVRSEAQVRHTDLPADVDLYLEHLSQQAVRGKKQIVVSDIESESSDIPRSLLLRAGIRALAVIPIYREDFILGTLWAGWTDRRSFSVSDVNYLAALANLAGIVITNNQIYRAVESERSRLAAILNSTRDGILVTDARGQLQLANPAAEEMLGFDLTVAHNQPLPTIISDEGLFRMLSEIARRGSRTATTELERDGQRLYVSASPIQLNDRQTPQGWVLVMRDITDVKHLDDMKTDFLATVAHDMKTPLTYVSGYAGLLLDEPLSENQIQLVEKIRKGIETLTQLINELSELSKIANRVGITMSPCQLVTIAKEVAGNLQGYAEDKGLTFHMEFPDDVPPVIGDARWLKRAITNLVDNAIKYTMPPGWVKISVQEFSGSVSVAVADSGIGISPANRRRIFEKFYRVRHRDTLHIQGTGLGLAMVKTIAEQHGGQVSVESELGAGSVFYLTIPKERSIADLLDEEGFLRGASSPGLGSSESSDVGVSHSSPYGTSSAQADDTIEGDIPPSL